MKISGTYRPFSWFYQW